MRVAVCHSFLDNIGGAEIVVLTLARELQADIYTTNIDRKKIADIGFKDVLPRIFSIGKVPTNAPLRHQKTIWLFSKKKLENEYDNIIVAGDWAFSIANKNNNCYWYIHSPARELWDLYVYTREHIVPWYQRPFFDLWVFYNRSLMKKYIKKMRKLFCNSKNTQKRIRKYLDENAEIIYPPIDTTEFYTKEPKDYWLSVNRLITHKRVEMQLSVFRKLPQEKLIIVGSYEKSSHFLSYKKKIVTNKPQNVSIKHWVSHSELLDLYANCKGFISTAKDEDFGMTVVEAMAAGKGVVAVNEGGYKESIINGKTGYLVNYDEKEILDTIKKVNKDPKVFSANAKRQAEKFSTKEFIRKIKRGMKNL